MIAVSIITIFFYLLTIFLLAVNLCSDRVFLEKNILLILGFIIFNTPRLAAGLQPRWALNIKKGQRGESRFSPLVAFTNLLREERNYYRKNTPRLAAGWRGYRAIYYTIAGVAILLIAYLGSQLVLEALL